MKVLCRQNRFYDTRRFGQPEIRLYHKKAKGKRSPRYLLKCGCCEEKLEIHYAVDGLEIGGVNGAIEDWREILLPLLLIERKGKRLIVHPATEPRSTTVESAQSAPLNCTRGPERLDRTRRPEVVEGPVEG